MTKNERKEKVNNIVNDYCILLDDLCKSNRNIAFIYYVDYMNKLSGVFDVLAIDSTMSLDEYEKFCNECLGKLELIYNKYR